MSTERTIETIVAEGDAAPIESQHGQPQREAAPNAEPSVESSAQPLIQLPTPQQTAAIAGPNWRVKGFRDAMNGSGAPPPWLIEDLLLDQSATLVSALPHSLKSLSFLYACLEAVVTKRVWGHFDASRVNSALFIETEDPPWLVEARIRGFAEGLGKKSGDTVPGFQYVCPGPFNLVAEARYIEQMLKSHKPSFAVISTLQNTLAGRKMGAQDEMAPVMNVVTGLARTVCPIILITHSPWDKRQRRAVGTVTQTANFLTTVHYVKMQNRKTGETNVHVLMDSKAGALDTDFHLKLKTDGDPHDPGSVRTVEYGGKGWPKGIGKAAVLAAIEDDPEASAREIAERAVVSERYVRNIMAEQRVEKKSKKRPRRSGKKGQAPPADGGSPSLAEYADTP